MVRTRSATPPVTPPTIAPTFIVLEVLSESGETLGRVNGVPLVEFEYLLVSAVELEFTPLRVVLLEFVPLLAVEPEFVPALVGFGLALVV